MSKKKKNFQPHKGNKVNQGGTFPFIENFNTWRKTCQGISGEQMMVKNIPNLYAFLKAHMMNNIRAGSRNRGRDGQGAIQFLEPIEAFVDNNLFTEGQANIIKTLAETLESFYLEGNDAGGKGPARDPAFILFTEQEKQRLVKRKDLVKFKDTMPQNFMTKRINLVLLLLNGLHTLMLLMVLMAAILLTKRYFQEQKQSSLIPKVCFG